MDASVRQAFAPALRQFCQLLAKDGVLPHRVDARVVATYFRTIFQIPCPMNFRDAGVLLFRLAIPEVYFQYRLEAERQIRGTWLGYNSVVKVFLDDARPPASIIKTLLHELAEIILSISYEMEAAPKILKSRERERWANKFAAMVKMPPGLFQPEAESCGLDLRMLAENYKDTIAGVSRQVRDLNASGLVYYVARFDVERHPEKNCPSLLKVIEASGGLPVLMADVVRTPRVSTRRRRGGALPPYNLPSTNHYRVMHPAIRKYTALNQPVFIPSLKGGAALEGGWGDLYGDQDLSVLIRPYGFRRVEGFFLMALHPDSLGLIGSQLGSLGAEVREDIGWLFSWASHTCERFYPKPVQLALALEDDNGNHIGDRYPFPQVKPIIEIDGAELWRETLFELESQTKDKR